MTAIRNNICANITNLQLTVKNILQHPPAAPKMYYINPIYNYE